MGDIARRPVIIDYVYPTGSGENFQKEVKEESTKMFRGKQVIETIRGREYSNFGLFTTKRAFMTGLLWSYEMKSLDEKLAEEGRQILLILDRCPSHMTISFELRNVKMLFLLGGTTASLQVRKSLLFAAFYDII